MLTKVLIANRGAIACRIIRTLKKLNIKAVAVCSEADAQSLHVRLADEAICIGAAAASDSYLRGDKILAAAQYTGAQAIHAGYVFYRKMRSLPLIVPPPTLPLLALRPNKCAPLA